MDGANKDTQPRILVVDDDPAIAGLVAQVLGEVGMRPTACYSAMAALDAFGRGAFDLAILDIMMPQMDGWELCARLRQASDIPVVFLTAKDAEGDVVLGFALGAADYIVKPFKPRELVARVRARLRAASDAGRAAGAAGPGMPTPSIFAARDIEVDTRAHEARLQGKSLELTPKEFAILAVLAEHAGSPVPARDLYEQAWREPYDQAAANTVMVHVRHLRRKLADIDASQPFIETVWGVGYKLRGEGGRDV